ncbi:inactive C-alpha-formylglycine-generating enzyme 2 [Aplysia californica]|uniref:Inactive C-alpha-formylglycine-generating enzyme 2 n=1 Tax=Aplysia californica TaxID=6500 RepID=A0ABM1AAU2_APLCA|nr:inactive C-alpha-formylglycine-generating enzyme 2 [Aplysia californica]
MARLFRNILVQLCHVQIVLFLVYVSSASAKLTDEEIKSFVELNVKNVLQQHKKERDLPNIGLRRPKADPKAEQNDSHPHPFHKPKIVDQIRYSYRRYREMILVRAGAFWKGTNDPKSETGEYPLREVKVNSFYMDAFPTINAEYWAFRAKKKFVRSESEKKGWSWVVDLFLSDETRDHYSMPGSKGWAAVKKAKWDTPEGPDSSLEDRWIHPVVHMSWHDARQFCEFQGKRLPTEAEWEFAARAGAINYAYPWGDGWERKRANLWQGTWPNENRRVDGFSMTSPVDAFRPQNLIGFYDIIGNVWEWTSTAYKDRMVEHDFHTKKAVLKGGSYVDSVNGKINYPVRNGQRMGQKQDYTAANTGFRCARSAPDVDAKIKKDTTTKKPKAQREARLVRKKRDEL